MINQTKPIFTGFNKLDELIGGFFPSEVTVIGSRAAIGKSSFILDSINYICANKTAKPLFFSIEMPEETIRQRLLSKISGILIQAIRCDSVIDKTTLECAEKTLSDYNLIIDDTPNLRIDSLVQKANKYVTEEGCNIIFIDYLGLITTYREYAPTYEQISGILRIIHIMARKLNIPVVITCQVARTAEDNEPGLDQLRGSGTIEQESDIIIFVDRKRQKEAESKVKGKFIVAKNRNGNLGSIDVLFNCDTCSFVE